MAIEEKIIFIAFFVDTNRSITQIRNYINNEVLPTIRSRLDFHFQGYPGGTPTITVENIDTILSVPGFTNRYEVAPIIYFRINVIEGTEQDAQTRFHTCLEDLKDRLRILLANISNQTRVIGMHYHMADGSTQEVTF